jgi:hypothetical protein
MHTYFTPLIFACILLTFEALAETHPRDSAAVKQSNPILRITSRVHSTSFFYFGGKIAEYNPGFDLNLNVETRNFGYTFFKAVDLTDIHSSFNFALAGIYKNFNFKNKFKFTPQVILLLEQPYKVVDEGSDFGVTFTSSCKLNSYLTIEETVIFFNLVFETGYMDIINRMRILYSKKHIDLIVMGWNNNGLMDHENHSTAALSVGYNRVKLSNRLMLGSSVMASDTVYSSDQSHVPKRKGIIFTLSLSMI